MAAIDYRAYPVLCVDDEEPNLIMMQYALDPHFAVDVETDPVIAAKRLTSMRYAVLLTDQRMPAMTGVELCAHARAVSPDTVRIMISGYSDAHATIDAVNRGAVSRYVQKPVREAELVEVVRTAVNMIHAKRAVAELESQMVRGASGEALRRQERRIAGDLQPYLDNAHSALLHLRDLVVAFGQARVEARLLDSLADTVEELEEGLAAMAERVDMLGGGGATRRPGADVHRVLRSMLRVSGRPHSPHQEEEALWVAISPDLLGQALGAVYRRALIVSSDNAVDIDIVVEDERVSIRITDDGPELSDEHLEALFDARLDPLPGDDGRAMALAAEHLRDAGGDIVPLRDGARTAVLLKLPRAAAPTAT